MVLTGHIPRKHNLMEKCEKNRNKKNDQLMIHNL